MLWVWMPSRVYSACLASAVVGTATRRGLGSVGRLRASSVGRVRASACISSSTKKVCATGAGSARPVVSMMMASKRLTLACSFLRATTRSPRTVQQMHPFITSITSSSAFSERIRSSTPIWVWTADRWPTLAPAGGGSTSSAQRHAPNSQGPPESATYQDPSLFNQPWLRLRTHSQ